MVPNGFPSTIYFIPSARNCKTQAQYYVEAQGNQYDAAGGYSVGGPRNTGSGIEYGPGDQAYGSSEMVYNYETGEWESIPSGHKWTQGDVEYTMMSDGTIHGDNGTIWATTGTQNITKRNDLTIRWYIQRLWINRTIRDRFQIDLQLKAKFVHSTKIILLALVLIKHTQVVKQDHRSPWEQVQIIQKTRI